MLSSLWKPLAFVLNVVKSAFWGPIEIEMADPIAAPAPVNELSGNSAKETTGQKVLQIFVALVILGVAGFWLYYIAVPAMITGFFYLLDLVISILFWGFLSAYLSFMMLAFGGVSPGGGGGRNTGTVVFRNVPIAKR